MNRIEKISLLKRLKGLTGVYSDKAIMVNFGMFKMIKDKDNDDLLLSEVTINPREIKSKEVKEVIKILKRLLEGSEITNDIEILIVNTIEKAIAGKISILQEEVKGLLGLSGEQNSENKSEKNIFEPEIGGTHEVNN